MNSAVEYQKKIQELESQLSLSRQGEDKFRSIHESSPDCVKELDLEGRLLSMNKYGTCLMEVDDFSACHLAFWPDFWPGRGREQALVAIAAAKTGKTSRFQAVCPTLKGFIKSWDVIVAPVRDAAENVTSIIAISRDISEFKHAETKILEQTKRDAFSAHIGNELIRETDLPAMLRRCAQHMVDDLDAAFARIWLLNDHDQMLELVASSGLYTHLDGGHARVPVGKFKIGLIASEKKPHLTNSVIGDSRVGEQEWAKREGMVAFAGYPLIVDDQVLGVMAMFARQEIPQNTVQCMAVVATQIALGIERKRSDDALRESEDRFRVMANNLPNFAWMAEANGAIFWYNERWYDYTGTDLAAMQGWGWRAVHHPDHVERVVARIKQSFDSGEIWEDTFPLRGKDGHYRWFLSRATPIRDAEGRVVRWFGTNTDINEQLESRLALENAQKLLAQVNSELEERVLKRTADLTAINNQLETLVYSIAHDLRAPLRSMQAFATILNTDFSAKLEPDGQEYARRISRSAEKMDALVKDLLDYGRTARLELPLGEVDVTNAWHDAALQYEVDIRRSGAIVQAIPPLPRVRANEPMLVQVFANLIGNALKFIAPGTTPRITLSAVTMDQGARFWVEDNGIGIAPEYHDRIFRVFERLHGKDFAGTGIGLSIVRKGIEQMGGKVGLESELGKGARFWIDLPAA